jgi:hypothetical protein
MKRSVRFVRLLGVLLSGVLITCSVALAGSIGGNMVQTRLLWQIQLPFSC